MKIKRDWIDTCYLVFIFVLMAVLGLTCHSMMSQAQQVKKSFGAVKVVNTKPAAPQTQNKTVTVTVRNTPCGKALLPAVANIAKAALASADEYKNQQATKEWTESVIFGGQAMIEMLGHSVGPDGMIDPYRAYTIVKGFHVFLVRQMVQKNITPAPMSGASLLASHAYLAAASPLCEQEEPEDKDTVKNKQQQHQISL